MNVKTFQGSSMAETLSLVKGELGLNAVILHTRSFRKRGILGLGGRNIVEVTAGLNAKPVRKQAKPTAQKNSVLSDDERTVAERFERRSVIRNTYGASTPQTQARNADSESGGGVATVGDTRQMATSMLAQPGFEMRQEMSALRSMVESLLQRSARQAADRTDLPKQLAKAYAHLIEQEVADEIAFRVVDDVKTELQPEQLSNVNLVRDRLAQKLASLVPVSTSKVARPASGVGCRSICLIGPTGVGKTTTIAKLAAAFKLRLKQKVGLITIDTYRIAAVDQLRTYANIIGVPLKVVLSPTELQQAIQELSNCDTILIDTAGRSHLDEQKLSELNAFVQAANPTEVHLVLSSTCAQEAMEAACARFSQIRVDQIIFTKLDEAVSFGVLLNVARKASKALSYITTGQDVPDHIEVGQPRRLAKLILGDKL